MAELVEGGSLENCFAPHGVTGVRIPIPPPEAMIITLENISNARDLGGMDAANGKKIKPKMLLRSSALFGASDDDVEKLKNEYNLAHVVDFRTEDERLEKPHEISRFDGVEYSFLNSFNKIQTEVTRDKKSEYLLLKTADKLTEEEAIEIIESFYNQLPHIDSLNDAYKKFFEILINNEQGAVLWHCSLGKDRAGIAAVLIEHVLGVNYLNILTDYLLTNEYLNQNISRSTSNAFRVFYGVRESFLEK